MRWEVDAIEDWDVRRRVKAGDVSGFTNCEVACGGLLRLAWWDFLVGMICFRI
jgi:hypothetical protein